MPLKYKILFGSQVFVVGYVMHSRYGLIAEARRKEDEKKELKAMISNKLAKGEGNFNPDRVKLIKRNV